MSTNQPRLQRRGTVYWFRCKILRDLIGHYGKREMLKSLGTKDRLEALQLIRQVSAEQDREFAQT